MHPIDAIFTKFIFQLRYLYEAAPMAFILEKAGGVATTGTEDILDIVPKVIHKLLLNN